MSPRVVFVGAPGAGKSTIAALVAEQLRCEHLDSDVMVEATANMSVADIFVSEGEPSFRQRERAAVVRALQSDSTVVSLGGGAVLDPATRADLRAHPVAWLQVSLADAATRAGLNQARPLLLGNVRSTLANLLDARTPLYQEVATQAFDTSAASAQDIAVEVVQWLTHMQGSGQRAITTKSDDESDATEALPSTEPNVAAAE